MIVFVLNCGSSSLKYALFKGEKRLASGLVEKIGFKGKLAHHGRSEFVEEKKFANHAEAISKALELLCSKENGVISSFEEISLVGHRVVHGGVGLTAPALVDSSVKAKIRGCISLAPLHNPANLLGIEACETLLPHAKNAAVFDTGFHSTLPKEAFVYALPIEYYDNLGLRRFGFHGTSVKYCCEKASEFLGKALGKLKVVCCHLGNGASVTAVSGGKSVDTSMGFTPLEGLVMGTRCGDLDPAIPLWLVENGLSVEEAKDVLNKKSGLLGLSGVSNDLRLVEEEAEKGNEKASLALDIYARRVKKYVGAYAALMDGLDVLIFTAGVGENSSLVRKKVCAQMSFLGIELDEGKNSTGEKGIRDIGKGRVRVLVVPTDEEKAIAKEVLKLVPTIT